MEKKKGETAYVPKLFTPRNEARDIFRAAPRAATGGGFWRWGSDNLYPYALAQMFRRSTTHRRIVNDKADYIAGKGFSHEEGLPRLAAFIRRVNRDGETLRQVLRKLALDKVLFGNAFVEVVTDGGASFLSLFHQDASRCRLAADGRHVLLHHDWSQYAAEEAKSLPLWPLTEEGADGKLHAVIHYKEYEPMFGHYGVPSYIAGMNVSAIAYKTDCWNISRLDNSFQLSGVMLLDGGVDNEQQAEELMRRAERRFAGKPGQVMFMIKDCGEGDGSRYIPIASSNEGDWKEPARTGHLRHRGGPFVVSFAEWTRLCVGFQCGAYSARVRGGTQYGDTLGTGGAARPAEGDYGGGAARGVRFAGGSEPSADAEQAALYESVGGPQGGRARLRPGE